MSRAVSSVRIVIRAAFTLQLLLGALIWSGHFDNLIPFHITLGVGIVLGLWTQAILALRGGVRPVQIVVALAWGGMLPIFGLTQERLLSGDQHWIVQVIHLAVGIAAVAQAEALAARIEAGHRRPALEGR